MKTAYVMNQHPYASCTFIRREIAALEAQGFEIARFSIREPETKPVDPLDVQEAAKTRCILAEGVLSLVSAALVTAISRPGRFMRAAWLTAKIGWRSDRGLAVNFAYLLEACVLARWVQSAGSVHVHSHFASNAATVAMLCHSLGGPPFSFTVHGPHDFDKPEAMALPVKIERAKFVVAVSSFGRSQLMRWCGHAEWSKIHVVHCGLDDSFLATEPSWLAKPARVVSVGRLTGQKGQSLLIDAARLLADADVEFELVLVGDGELRNELQARIRALKLEQRVRITGWQTEDEVRQHLQDARVVVLPSFAEGLPVVIMEALALARPVGATYVAGIPELVVPGHSGWLVPAGAVEELSIALCEAIESPDERLFEMGQNGRQDVLDRHSAEKEAAKLGTLFR